MTDLNERYGALINGILEFYGDDVILTEQLRHANVTEEIWDDGRAGGHFRMDIPRNALRLQMNDVQAWALDSDKTPIEIFLHVEDGRLIGGEWVKLTGTPIVNWPPLQIRRSAPTYSPDGQLID